MNSKIATKNLFLLAQSKNVIEKLLPAQSLIFVQVKENHNISQEEKVKERRRYRWRGFSEKEPGRKLWTKYGLIVATAGVTLGAGFFSFNKNDDNQKQKSIEGPAQSKELVSKQDVAVAVKEGFPSKYGQRISTLPTYRRDEVAKHNTADKLVWVTFNHGVYDVTDFIESHPGGSKIKLAAGKGLEAYFSVYAVHKSDQVMEIMESLRIGNVHSDDMKEEMNVDLNDPFSGDPKRNPVLNVNSMKPFNAEPPPELILETFNTPNDLFFVRNHLPVPKIEPNSFNLELAGEGLRKPINFTVKNLKKRFKTHTLSITMQCAGNRRSNMATVKPVRGLSWGNTAISTATWTGVKLADLLEASGIKEEEVEHVIFQGADKDIEGVAYETSIPASTAFDPRKDVLLAFEMNGEELPLDHGYPIRVVVPGVIGGRNVKWLKKIIVSKKESESHWQASDYKTFNPSVDWGNADFSKSTPIQEYPIQSAICEPSPGAVLDDADDVTVKGYAYSGGGRGIIRVDVSIDGGKTWQGADLQKEKQPMHREWAWTLWEATISIPKNMKGKKLELVCKAVDTSHNAQPDSIEGIWNLRGLIHNAWHRIQVQVPRS